MGRFLGAAGTVTGSRFLVEACGRRVLVDAVYTASTRLALPSTRAEKAKPATRVAIVWMEPMWLT